MKALSIVVLPLFAFSGFCWAQQTAQLQTDKDKLSYSIGASIGKNLHSESPDVNADLLLEGIKAGLSGEKLRLSDKEIQIIMSAYQRDLRQHAMTNRQQALLDNKKAGDEYLENYRKKPGVNVLASGVMFRVLKAGTGLKPKITDTVNVNYKGALTNGKQFDATDAGHPMDLKVAALINGWKSALVEMPVGSRWEIVIPSTLAYGERGVGSDIGPNEVLVFDVELLAIR